MKEFLLNPDELLYLAAKEGIDEVEGVADEISTLDGNSLSVKIADIEQALDKKGYQEMDFDGNCNPDETLMELIRIMLESEGKITISNRIAGKGQSEHVFCVREGDICEIEVMEDGAYRLRKTTIEELKIALPYYIVESENSITDEYRIRESHVQRAAMLCSHGSEKRGLEELKESGLNERIAEIVLKSLVGRNDMYVTLFDFNTEKSADFRSVILIKDDIFLRLDNDISEDNETLQVFTYIGRSEVGTLLNNGLQLFGLG